MRLGEKMGKFCSHTSFKTIITITIRHIISVPGLALVPTCVNVLHSYLESFPADLYVLLFMLDSVRLRD